MDMEKNISRRSFLKNGSKSLLAASTLPYLLGSGTKLFAGESSQMTNLKTYLNHFMVNESIIKEVIGEALSCGGDYCDVFFQHTINNDISLQDKIVNRASSSINLGVGIRVLKGNQTGYSFTEELTEKAMKLAAKTAASIAESGKSIKPVDFKLHTHPDYYPVITGWQDVTIDKKIPLLQSINDRGFSLDKRVIKCTVRFSDQTSYELIATSDGKITYDYKPYTWCAVTCVAEQDGRREQNFSWLSSRSGLEFMTEANKEYLATTAVNRTMPLFEAVKPSPGQMEVVLAAGDSGILLHEAIGHGMEADFNRKNISIFCDKINKPVAEKFVSIVDDGTNLNLPGSINVDDEGNDSEKTYLVENGILKSYLHDRISANYYKLKSTGNGRRESFRFPPMPRMRNTYMPPGPHKKEEIIQSVKKGLYAESFINGEVRIGGGDFTFYVKSGRLIEDGKLTKHIKEVNIIGNGPQVLSNITMVADDFKMSNGGMCGKWGQMVYVSMGLPTVKVSKITVGGV